MDASSNVLKLALPLGFADLFGAAYTKRQQSRLARVNTRIAECNDNVVIALVVSAAFAHTCMRFGAALQNDAKASMREGKR